MIEILLKKSVYSGGGKSRRFEQKTTLPAVPTKGATISDGGMPHDVTQVIFIMGATMVEVFVHSIEAYGDQYDRECEGLLSQGWLEIQAYQQGAIGTSDGQ